VFVEDCKVKSSLVEIALQIGECALLEEEFNHHKTATKAGINEASALVLSLLVIEDVRRGVFVDQVARLVVTGR
jgi:hypothetical protein